MGRERNNVSFGEWFGIGLVALGAVLLLVCAVIAFDSGYGLWSVASVLQAVCSAGMAVAMARESLYG